MSAVIIALGWSPVARRHDVRGFRAAHQPSNDFAIAHAASIFASTGGSMALSVIGRDGEYRWSVAPIVMRPEKAA